MIEDEKFGSVVLSRLMSFAFGFVAVLEGDNIAPPPSVDADDAFLDEDGAEQPVAS
jgi:hypothetical protein